jgi:hypothetical protein
MMREQVSLRAHFLLFLGLAVGVLLVMAGTGFWRGNLREGALFLGIALGIAVLFFRRRLLALCVLALSVMIALFSMGAISHRSIPASIAALTALAVVYLLMRWDLKKNSARALGDWKSFLVKDEKP